MKNYQIKTIDERTVSDQIMKEIFQYGWENPIKNKNVEYQLKHWETGYLYFVDKLEMKELSNKVGLSDQAILNRYHDKGYIAILLTECFPIWILPFIPKIEEEDIDWESPTGANRADLISREALIGSKGRGLMGEIKIRNRKIKIQVSSFSKESLEHLDNGGKVRLYSFHKSKRTLELRILEVMRNHTRN